MRVHFFLDDGFTPMLRSLFISLSANDAVRRFVIGFPLARRVSRRFVAGERLDEAVAAIRRLNQRGLLATFDHLGENVRSADEAREAAGEYIRMLDAIAQGQLQSNVSLKLTHMGLDLGTDVCLENLRRILTRAKQSGIFVRIDMEGSPYTQRTLDTYELLRPEGFDNIGVVIQAYLYRSADDAAGWRHRVRGSASARAPTRSRLRLRTRRSTTWTKTTRNWRQSCGSRRR